MTLDLPLDVLADIFPAFLITDAGLVISHVGPSVARLMPEAATGVSLWDAFVLERPSDPTVLTTPSSRRIPVVLRQADGTIVLRGLAIRLGDQVAFFVSHAAATLLNNHASGLSFIDFSPADASLDALLAVEVQRATVTEMERLIAELTVAREVAVSADRAKGEFLANVSHEIRTPLTAILGFAELLSRQAALSAPDRSHVDRIVEGAHSLLRVVNQILDWSKLENDNVTVDTRGFAPLQLARDCLGLIDGQIRGKPVELRLEADADLPATMWADDQKLSQVIMNLLSNAVKFTKAGAITLRIGFDRSAGELIVAVEDTGCGIPAQAMDRLFKRFSQADGSISRAHGGTGLGLAISKGLVELMGGEISVLSQLGVGSCFTVRIPCAETPAGRTVTDGEVGAVPAELPPLARPGRILLADDNEANRHLITAFLAELGYELVSVTDGRAAVSAAETGAYDLILMDIQMPVLDGIAAAAEIRGGAGPNAATPILAVSANAGSRSLVDWRKSGIDDCVAKPLDLIELAGKVAQFSDPSARG
jgi:signal transduction histidine kinase